MDRPKIARAGGGGGKSRRALRRQRAATGAGAGLAPGAGNGNDSGRAADGGPRHHPKRAREASADGGLREKRRRHESTTGVGARAGTRRDGKKGQAKGIGATSALQSKFKAKLESGQFRWLNEQLYTTSSEEAVRLFKRKPELYEVYHRGFESQVQRWPENPAAMIAREVGDMPEGTIVGDFGCGNALIARTVPHTVHSFDLCETNEHVTVASSADVPLEDASLDVAVFSLSLMGTDYQRFLLEARRTLKVGGTLIVAEVKSRFCSAAKGAADSARDMERGIASFKRVLKKLGFRLINEEIDNRMFVLFRFRKAAMLGGSAQEAELARRIKARGFLEENEGVLKSCVYKKR
ncbi:Ribosomal RNA-processing protein 8 [Hondaea fermentalgiana]|uniref:Ribosomal RNA-processing protein 8 n=1 Tax=Hondaea fermentalgiana TaxID=2315210 RepID=A0A2R5GGW2_9STRA|nr:Ribosomal RNA-processing protein 8 [Hondaea fermentalgiana]|eukprot:GBG30127.1 Ribosomal RNA-processing protein 8 [Hondaea fermentalgiana]